MHLSDASPVGYLPPRNGLERRICAFLFQSMVRSKRVHIDFGDSSQVDYSETDFVVASPRLSAILLLLAAPDFWVGELFIQGRWYLKKGQLADFLEEIRYEAQGVYRLYYDFVRSIRGIRYFLRQYILNRFYTRQVKRHYDVDSRIYEMILDSEMVYTCAFFSEENEALAPAQRNKIATTIQRMELPSGCAHVLDIGCGWGAMARAIVQKHSEAKVCGLSISAGQIEWAKRRDIETLSPSEVQRIEYRLEDYVEHRAQSIYDSISVIGMIEHVGLGGYKEFFGKIHSFLKPGGTAVIHTIISPCVAVPTNRWIDRHIFTGGYAPSLSELTDGAERRPFRVMAVHIHEPIHYRRTIECWLANFMSNLPTIDHYLREAGFTGAEVNTFIRTWNFYLSAVRNMFDVGNNRRSYQVAQLVIKKLDADESSKSSASN